MVTTAHDIGDTRRLQGTFTNVAGTATNPTAIALTINAPDGTQTVKAISDLTSNVIGIYYYDHAFTTAGRHIVNWTATGAVIAAAEVEYYIRKKGAV